MYLGLGNPVPGNLGFWMTIRESGWEIMFLYSKLFI